MYTDAIFHFLTFHVEAELQVLTVTLMKVTVIRDVATCIVIEISDVTTAFIIRTMIMKAASTSETPIVSARLLVHGETSWKESYSHVLSS
jgi:hypothetical protein